MAYPDTEKMSQDVCVPGMDSRRTVPINPMPTFPSTSHIIYTLVCVYPLFLYTYMRFVRMCACTQRHYECFRNTKVRVVLLFERHGVFRLNGMWVFVQMVRSDSFLSLSSNNTHTHTHTPTNTRSVLITVGEPCW